MLDLKILTTCIGDLEDQKVMNMLKNIGADAFTTNAAEGVKIALSWVK